MTLFQPILPFPLESGSQIIFRPAIPIIWDSPTGNKKVAPTSELPKRVINTHEDGDHVWGNQLFTDSEIIGHRPLPERMQEVADPTGMQQMLEKLGNPADRLEFEAIHPGLEAILST